jgi:hypothetical protein
VERLTKPRTTPQNRKFSALVGDVVRQHPMIPYRRPFATEAWRRFFIASYVREARWEAYNAGAPDPFPVRPVPSSDLDSRQMAELIEFVQAWCAQNDIELSK